MNYLTCQEKQKLQKRLVHFAKKHLGKPYKYGARLWEAPRYFDCSSFIQYLYKRIGIDLPRTALQQAHLGKKIDPRKQKLEVGDLIFIKGKWGHYNPDFLQGIGHVCMYLGNNQVVHAKWDAKEGGEVRLDPLSKILKRKDLVVIKRILD